jgi:hypothetical protein
LLLLKLFTYAPECLGSSADSLRRLVDLPGQPVQRFSLHLAGQISGEVLRLAGCLLRLVHEIGCARAC